MDSSVSPKEEIWFLRVCHRISNAVYKAYVMKCFCFVCYNEFWVGGGESEPDQLNIQREMGSGKVSSLHALKKLGRVKAEL
jgi:hypothetical protein